MYSPGEKLKSGRVALSTVPSPAVWALHSSRPGTSSSWLEIGWNMMLKVAFWRSLQAALNRDTDCCRRGVTVPESVHMVIEDY